MATWIAFLVCFPWSSVGSAAPPSFARIAWAEWHTNYRGIQRTYLRKGRTPYFDSVVVQSADGRRMARVIFPPGRAGELLVDDGSYQWRYAPRRNGVLVAPSRGAHNRRRQEPRRQPSVEQVSSGVVAGRAATAYTIIPLRPTNPRLTVWLDDQTLVTLKTEFLDPRRQIAAQEFRRIQFGPQQIRFEWPTGATPLVLPWSDGPVRLKPVSSAMPIALPLPLPDDILFDGIWLKNIEDRNVFWLHYHSRDRRQQFSLFESFRGSPMHETAPGAVRWDVGPLNITVVGTMTESVQRRIMHSMRLFGG